MLAVLDSTSRLESTYWKVISQIVGTWDDHDYGLNDAGKEFEGKDVSQQLMLDFLDEAPDSPR
jgi:hypothetical protein